MRFLLSILFALLCTTCTYAAADSIAVQKWNLHFQGTYIYQYQPAFSSKYSGPNSLGNALDKENSVTGTLFFGTRLWKNAELYINPEIAGGSGLSGAFGMAASTNGETFRVGDPSPTLYLARGYLKQTFPLSKELGKTDDGQNQLQGAEPAKYLRFYLGKFSLGDLFDNNQYSKDPRSQFMNWCLMSNGAWDYAANLRGYTLSFASVLQWNNMSYKLALAALPQVANGEDLNTNLGQEYSLNAEVVRAYKLNNKDGHLRILGYYNNGDMGNYAQAISDGSYSVISTRQYGRTKIGFGINADQQLTETLGLFARAGWNDGKNETWCFTEADESISAGLSLNGKNWKRVNDVVGLAVVVNGLSQSHRDYLQGGGLGFQLGDGTLNYANETVTELYYSCKPTANGIWFTADYQLVLNPGYNSDRGPVNVFSFRVHVEL